MAGSRKRSETEREEGGKDPKLLEKDGGETEQPPAKKLNAGGGDQGTQLTEMMSEISALKETMESWKELFRQELGLGSAVDNLEEEEVNPVQLKEKLGAMKKDCAILTSSAVGYQSSLDALRKEVRHLRQASETSPSDQNVSTTLIDPGLARQFRHMESEVEQGREMMKEMQDELVAVTYSPETFEAKQQVDRLHKLEKENAQLKKELSESNVGGIKGQVASLTKQVQEVQVKYKALQEYTCSLDRDYNLLKSKSKAK
jgi:hypothetical protein